jgi:ribosome-associated toxin RatA of RatAB toxin-antitoxin module
MSEIATLLLVGPNDDVIVFSAFVIEKITMEKLNKLLERIVKKEEASYLIGEKIYLGWVNQHRMLIQSEPEAIYDFLTDFNQFKRWCPMEDISIRKVTPGELQVGTKLHFKLRFRIQPEWDSKVIYLKRPNRIVYKFLNGIFEDGIEIWKLEKKERETEVTHTLLYHINRWIDMVGWFLLGGEKKHNELTKTALSRLKSLLEGNPPSPPFNKGEKGGFGSFF